MAGDAAATVAPEDVSALKFQLARLATDERLREQLRAAGLERARQFDWRRTAARTLEVYARAVSRAKNRAPRAQREFVIAAPPTPREAGEGK